MTPERWQRVEELLEAALERDGAERTAFLRRACAGEPSLERQVATLAEAFEAADGFLEAPAIDHLSGPGGDGDDGGDGEDEHAAATEESFGPYRIDRRLGAGGMGTVYLAERTGEFRKHVALKVARFGMPPSALRRFRAERQILAQLEHPGIARLLDGGSTPSGRPFLVMEHVEGEPIDRYCERRRLPLRERIELFRKVCDAVHHAHRMLVVHRDVKPSNILVTPDGDPKLLDFGIAKLLDPTTFPGPPEPTRTDQRPMTPGWASPEQLRGGPITPASDVFSLGVLLHKLLTGHLPHHPGRDADPATAPSRPSLVVAGAGAAEPASMGLERRHLARRLAGDLDTIVVRALDPEPERRYASVERLSDDLRRHLEGLPIAARPDSVGYRAGKLLRRHRWRVTAAAATLLVSAVALGAQLVQERQRARRVSGDLVELLGAADPLLTGGDPLATLEILDRRVHRIEEELGMAPAERGRLLENVGRLYGRLGAVERARGVLERSLELRREAGEEGLELASALLEVASIYQGLSEYRRAERLFWQAFEIRRRLLGPGHPEVAEPLGYLGLLYSFQGRRAWARKWSRRAYEIRRAALPADHPAVADSLAGLGIVAFHHGDLAEAERYATRALEMAVRLHGPDHLRAVVLRNNLAAVHVERGENDRAEALLRSAAELWPRIVGPDHPQLAFAFYNLGRMHLGRGETERAGELFERACGRWRRTLGEHHHNLLICLRGLGEVALEDGDLPRAQELFERADEVRRRVLGGAGPIPAATSHASLGRVALRQGRGEDAAEHLRTARGLLRELLATDPDRPRDRMRLAEVHAGLAELRERRGDEAAAQRSWERVLAVSDPAIERLDAAALLDLRARALLHLGRVGEARTVAEELHARGWRRPTGLAELLRRGGGQPVTGSG